MSLHDWVSNTRDRVRREGLSAVGDSLYSAYRGSWRITGSRLPLGENVFDREWDMLVVLDGCRVDTLKEVLATETFGFGTDSGTIRSVGSTSREWLAKTFTPDRREAIRGTAYVSANPYTEEIFEDDADGSSPFNPATWDTVSPDAFLALEEVWRNGWDDDLGTVPPSVVTDHAIRVGREVEAERLVVHYMQPHQPFVGEDAQGSGSTWVDGNCWEAIRTGKATNAEVETAYRENLSVVLADVERLLENVDAPRTVISSDHGNAMGEWGIYGHPNGFLHDSVKIVPWVETSGRDVGTYEPDAHPDKGETVAQTTEDRLKDLGYL